MTVTTPLTRRHAAAALGIVALVGVVLIGGYSLVTDGDDRSAGNAGSPTPTEAPGPMSSPTAATADPGPNRTVALQQWFVEDDKLLLFHTAAPKNQTPGREAIEALLLGVPEPLAETGVETAIPEGTELADISIANGTAEVSLLGEFPDDVDSQQDLALAQIVYTLTQFRTVDEVAIAWESTDSATTGIAPEGRERYHDYLPPIVVEEPYAGEVVDRMFALSGIANVYEATVSYRLVDEDGEVVHEGFTTATCGSGCWGTFEDTITYDGNRDWVELQVFESSAEDGSPLHLVKLPINFSHK